VENKIPPDTTQISVAVEDRFLMIGIKEAASLLPEMDAAENLAHTMSYMRGDYTLVIDIRGIKDLYRDVKEFIWALSEAVYQENIIVLVSTKLEEEILRILTSEKTPSFQKLLGVKKATPKINYNQLDITEFDPYFGIDEHPSHILSTWEEGGKKNLPSRYRLTQYSSDQEAAYKTKNQDEYENYRDALRDEYQIALLCEFIKEHGRNSMLNEYAFTINKDQITVTPYHSHAAYETFAPEQSQTIIARPGVIAQRTRSILSQELKEFEVIINQPKVKENEIQRFLTQHRHFFRGLNYENVYPQLVLEKRGKAKLIPDFICEPIGSEWCDILDLKIPIEKPIDVGGEDRARLAVVITDGIAQLREYAAWFEDEQNFKNFRKKIWFNRL
jgi:hypothetical protein